MMEKNQRKATQRNVPSSSSQSYTIDDDEGAGSTISSDFDNYHKALFDLWTQEPSPLRAPTTYPSL